MGRVHSMHLDRRVPAGSLAEAAFAGLQDTAPRAALLSLHARAEAVDPDSWEDPSLAQVWGPRLAAYVVPADAVASFTLGRLPRDAGRRAAIEALSDRVLSVLDGRAMRSNELFRTFDDLPNPVVVRAAAAAGRFVIRWDARTTTVIPIEPLDVDEEDARVDLARRYTAWFGSSAGAEGFARWAGVALDDARITWAKVDALELPKGRRAEGVRLLPFADPYLYDRPQPKTPARELPGAVLLDGRVAGSWARQQAKLTLRPAPRVRLNDIGRLEAAANELAAPLGRAMTVTVVRADAG